MFLPDYCRKAKGWYVCRCSNPDTVTRVLLCESRSHCLQICKELNQLRYASPPLAICDLSTISKSDLQIVLDSYRASLSKILSSKAPCGSRKRTTTPQATSSRDQN